MRGSVLFRGAIPPRAEELVADLEPQGIPVKRLPERPNVDWSLEMAHSQKLYAKSHLATLLVWGLW